MEKSNLAKQHNIDRLVLGVVEPSGAIPDLDRLIHERMRLGIVSALAANQSLTFNELKKLLKTTDGNLSVHARKLEDANYFGCTKSFDCRLPKPQNRLTHPRPPALANH